MKNTKITARLNEPLSADQNLIYCATVNLTWNELSDFLGGQVTFNRPNETVDFLNRKSFTKEMLDKGCYLAYADRVGNGVVDRIVKNLKEKFGETSRIDFSNLQPSDILAYSFLLKVLTFANKFENLDEHLYFDGTLVKAFGLEKVRAGNKLLDQVYVLYYDDPMNFSIALKTESDDVIVLTQTPSQGSMGEIISRCEGVFGSEYHNSKHGGRLHPNESLMIPKLVFDLEHHFKELIGQDALVNGNLSGYFVADAVQFIKFLLNEEGAKLRSEMAMTMRCMAFVQEEPRRFIFDKPFLVYLKQGGKQPYFAAWIANTELMKK